MYGWKLLAVVALVTAVMVGFADPTAAQTPAPATGTVVAAHAPMGANPCCMPCGYVMYPHAGMAMGYPAYAPTMMSSTAYTAQPRRRLFNRRSEAVYVSGMATPMTPTMGSYTVMPTPTQPVTFAPMPMPGTAVTGTAATTPPTTVTPATGTTTIPSATAARPGDGTLPLATLPPAYFMNVNGRYVPTAGSSFYYYPMDSVQMDTTRRGFRLFRR